MVVIPFLFLRRGAFVRRAILELRADQNPTRPAMLNMVVEGRSLPVRACLVYADPEENREIAAGEVPDFKSLGSIKVHLPATRATQLKVWLHQLTPEGESEGLPASVSVAWVDRKREYELSSANGHVTLPFSGEACEIEMAFRRESVSGQWSDLQGLSS